MRKLLWIWIAALTTLAGAPAGAVSISFADLTSDTVLSTDRLEFTNFETPGFQFGFDADDWQLTLFEDDDTLRIEHVSGPLLVGPLGLVRFKLNYDVRATNSENLISGIDLLLPDDGTSTSALGATHITKRISPTGDVLRAFDWACGPFGCTGEDLEDSVSFTPRELLEVRETFTFVGIGGTAEFSYADNVFLAPEPQTGVLLMLGLTGLSWRRHPRRRSSSSK